MAVVAPLARMASNTGFGPIVARAVPVAATPGEPRRSRGSRSGPADRGPAASGVGPGRLGRRSRPVAGRGRIGYNPRPMTAATAEHLLCVLIAVAYVAGSVPFGLLVGLANGVDVRTAGSGNIGATNVGRLLGRRFFVVVFACDALKGLVPMLVAARVIGRTWPEGTVPDGVYGLWLGVAFAAIGGHMFSLFLRFKGGKGVATTAGALLGLWPYYTLPAVGMIAVFVVLYRTTRYISVGSVAGSASFPLWYVGIGLAAGWDPLGRQQWPLLAFSVVVAGLIVFKHRSNLARLWAGTENRAAPRGAAARS